jgi:multiple sugar transport system substrate-binding protein
MKLFKDLVVLTDRSEPRVPLEVYKAVSDTIQACQLSGADPKQAAEEGSQRIESFPPDTRVPRCWIILAALQRRLTR